MKRFSIPILFLICLVASLKINAQSFVRLDDATGIKLTSNNIDSIQKACDSLITALPNSIKSNFKIFDCGFYLQQTSYQGGYPDEFLKMITKAQQQAQYYFLIGRGLTEGGTITFFVDLKFPDWSCLSNGEIDGLKTNISILLSNGDPNFMIKNEVESLYMVSSFSKDLLNCCQDANRDYCVIDDPDKIKFVIAYDNTTISINDNKQKLLITDEPAMPKFTFSILYIDPYCQIIPCYGTLTLRVKIYYDRNCSIREKIDSLVFGVFNVGVNKPYVLDPYYGTVTIDNKVFNVIQGGRVEIKIFTNLNTLIKTIKFAIKGQSPKIKKAMTYLNEDPFNEMWFFKKIIKFESGKTDKNLLNQFYPNNKYEDDIWSSWTSVDKCPLWGYPCGWGAMQLDNPSPPSQALWDWKANLYKGYNLLLSKVLELDSTNSQNINDWCRDVHIWNTNKQHKNSKIVAHDDFDEGGITWTHALSPLFEGYANSWVKEHFKSVPANKHSFMDAMLIKYNNGLGSDDHSECPKNHYYILLDDDNKTSTPKKWLVFTGAWRNGKCENYVRDISLTNEN